MIGSVPPLNLPPAPNKPPRAPEAVFDIDIVFAFDNIVVVVDVIVEEDCDVHFGSRVDDTDDRDVGMCGS